MKNDPWQNRVLWIGAGVVLAVLIGGALLLFGPKAAQAPADTATSTPAAASTTSVNLGNGVVAQVPAGATVKEVSSGAPQPPSLDGPIKITPSNSAQADQILRSDEETVIGELKKDPARLDLWLQLGVYRKMGGDYAGAIAAWDYVAAVGPNSIKYVAYGNLGDLYMNFDKNYAKAVASYKAALAINPSVISYYYSLYTLYRYDLNNLGAAADIVAQGLRANPGDPTLLSLQKQLQSS